MSLCDDVRAKLSDMLVGELAPEQASGVEAHLKECAPCRAQAEALIAQDRILAELAARDRIEVLVSRVRAALTGAVPAPAPEAGASRWVLLRKGIAWFAAAAAGGLIVWGALTPHHPPSQGPLTSVPPLPRKDDSPKQNPKDLTPPAPPEEPEPPRIVEPYRPPPPLRKPDVEPEKPIAPPEPALPEPAPVPQKTVPDTIVKEPARPSKSGEEIAVERGFAFLTAQASRRDNERNSAELTLYALLRAGVPDAPVGQSDSLLHGLLQNMLSSKLERTCNVALQAMILEELDPAKHQKRIWQCAQFLVDNQCTNGQWTHGEASSFTDDVSVAVGVPRKDVSTGDTATKTSRPLSPGDLPKPRVGLIFSVTQRREIQSSGDNFNSFFAALGLRACQDAGISLPAPVVERAMKAWREGRNGTGWGYARGDVPCSSMTAAGVAGLTILDGIRDGEKAASWKRDADIQGGLTWLARNFSVTENSSQARPRGNDAKAWMPNVCLFAAERAGTLWGTERFGTCEWHPEGVRALLASQQADGSWGNNVADTGFAVLFLKRIK